MGKLELLLHDQPEKTQLSPATVNACLRGLEQLGRVEEVTGQKRNRFQIGSQTKSNIGKTGKTMLSFCTNAGC